jgi:hypothetical protein
MFHINQFFRELRINSSASNKFDVSTPRLKNVTKRITYYMCLEKNPKKTLNNVLTNNGFKRGDINSYLYLPCGYTNVEKELKNIDIPVSKYIFGFIGCDEIIRKNSLWEILEKAYGRDGAKQIMPESFIINNPHQFEVALQEIRRGTILICKKNIQRKMGLALTFTENDLIKAKNDNFKVAQRFLKNTMQIHGRKMNMRLYYMIRKYKGKIQFFVNKNGKVLYTKNKTGNDVTFETHITSQMDVELYEKENMPHDFKELKNMIGEESYKRIWGEIIKKITDLSKAIAPSVSKNTKYENKVCFQLFGMDVILENDGKPYILELNKGPSMKAFNEKDEKLKENIFESTFKVAGLLKNRLKSSNYVKVYETL